MAPDRFAVTDAARTLRLALVFFGALALAGWGVDLFDRLGPVLTSALALFAAAFAMLTVACDRELRDYLRAIGRAGRRRLRSAAAKSPGVKRAAS